MGCKGIKSNPNGQNQSQNEFKGRYPYNSCLNQGDFRHFSLN